MLLLGYLETLTCPNPRCQASHRPGGLVEQLPTPVRAELTPVETASSEECTQIVEKSLLSELRQIYDLLSLDKTRQIEEIVEESRLNSSKVLANLFDLEMKGLVRQLHGKQFLKVLL